MGADPVRQGLAPGGLAKAVIAGPQHRHEDLGVLDLAGLALTTSTVCRRSQQKASPPPGGPGASTASASRASAGKAHRNGCTGSRRDRPTCTPPTTAPGSRPSRSSVWISLQSGKGRTAPGGGGGGNKSRSRAAVIKTSGKGQLKPAAEARIRYSPTVLRPMEHDLAISRWLRPHSMPEPQNLSYLTHG
jgi:hypothetical protein